MWMIVVPVWCGKMWQFCNMRLSVVHSFSVQERHWKNFFKKKTVIHLFCNEKFIPLHSPAFVTELADNCLRLARLEETPFSLQRCKVTDDCKTGQISRCPMWKNRRTERLFLTRTCLSRNMIRREKNFYFFINFSFAATTGSWPSHPTESGGKDTNAHTVDYG